MVAAYLAENRDRITAEWMDAVRDDSQIPAADRLTRTALEDHFPAMLDELVVALKRPDQEVEGKEIRETGAEHGKARWRSGYRLDEVLRELARIREDLAETRSGRDGPGLQHAAIIPGRRLRG